MSDSGFSFSLPVSSMYIDESGTRNSSGGFYVVGYIKTREPSVLYRRAKVLLDAGSRRGVYSFDKEIKFSKLNKSSMDLYFSLIELMREENVRIGASVYPSDSFPASEPTWRTQAKMAARLIAGTTAQNELVNVFLDLVSTPVEAPMGKMIAGMAHKRLKRGGNVVTAYELDSRGTILLQLADLVAGSIAFYRKHKALTGENVRGIDKPKARVATRLMNVYSLLDFEDYRDEHVNILTFRENSFDRA